MRDVFSIRPRQSKSWRQINCTTRAKITLLPSDVGSKGEKKKLHQEAGGAGESPAGRAGL